MIDGPDRQSHLDQSFDVFDLCTADATEPTLHQQFQKHIDK